MSSGLLRRAAAEMRANAEGCIPGPWRVEMDEDSGQQYVVGARDIAEVHEWSTGLRNPEHIASWHPAVALAVANWLDDTARIADEQSAIATSAGIPITADEYVNANDKAALAVARAYLGADA